MVLNKKGTDLLKDFLVRWGVLLVIYYIFHNFIVPRLPVEMKDKIANDIPTRMVVFVILGLCLVSGYRLFGINIGIVVGLLYLNIIIDGVNRSKSKNVNTNTANNTTMGEATLPINSNKVEEQEVAENAVNSVAAEEPAAEEPAAEEPAAEEHNSLKALNSDLYISNEELEKQNKGRVSKEVLETRFAIHLEGSDQFKHNDTSYQRNNTQYVAGELLESGFPALSDNCLPINELQDDVVANNKLKETFQNQNMKNRFTTANQFNDAQTNLVGCKDNKKDIPILCLKNNLLQTGKRQYSAQGTSTNSNNPVGYSK